MEHPSFDTSQPTTRRILSDEQFAAFRRDIELLMGYEYQRKNPPRSIGSKGLLITEMTAHLESVEEKRAS